MDVYKDLLAGKTKLSLVGLGYVGMPIAVAFAKHVQVVGFDINEHKIAQYKKGLDPTQEVGDAAVKNTTVAFTSDETKLREAKFHIVAVPTPVNQDKTPDLAPVIGASTILGRNLTKGSVVVYESTVYPGVTEEICVPLLEKGSGLKCGRDFKIGYSPERINPGDKKHRLENIIKIVSGMDKKTLETIASVYELVIKAGVHRASCIKVAEAAKLMENSQRDINIAFVNELSMAFDCMGIDTNEVIDAMNTKWNSLGFRPGLVGGHCIGIDPYYFVYEAEKFGYHSQIVSAGRRVNDGMGAFVADASIKQLVKAGKVVRDAKVVILGLTFKENCPDIRNSKVADIIHRLQEYDIKPQICDPWADPEEAQAVYGVDLLPLNKVKDVDCLIFAVSHKQFTKLSMKAIDKLYKPAKDNKSKVLIDVKNIFTRAALEKTGYSFWKL